MKTLILILTAALLIGCGGGKQVIRDGAASQVDQVVSNGCQLKYVNIKKNSVQIKCYKPSNSCADE